MKPKSQIIEPRQAFEIQNAQYVDRILLAGIVPALSGGTEFSTNVSSDGHFYSQFITGSFETIASPAGAVIDTGVNYLSGRFKDGTRYLSNDRIPLNLLLSPGRRKSATSTTVLTDPPAPSLFYPLEFEHLWTVNSNITIDVANTSDEPCRFEIVFHGLRIVSSAAADACRSKFARRQ